MKKNILGMSLIEVIVALGVFSIVSLAITSFISQATNSVSTIEEKMNVIELDKKIVIFSAGKNLCEKYFTDNPTAGTFVTTAFPPTEIPITHLYGSLTDTVALASNNMLLSPTGKIAIDTIKLVSITGTAPNYSANLKIKFKDSKISRKPIETSVILNTSVSGLNTLVQGCRIAATAATGPAPTLQVAKSPITSFYFQYEWPFNPGTWKVFETTTSCPVGSIALTCLACLDASNTCAPNIQSMTAWEFWTDATYSQVDFTLSKENAQTCKLRMSMSMNPMDINSAVYLVFSNKYMRLQADCLSLL